MTVWRQDWNGTRRPFLRSAAVLAAIAGLLGHAPVHAQATTEQVVINRVTGYAISGFDPVAYFTDGQPRPGQDRYESVYDGAVWRFRNEGNLNAFRRHPEIYEPLFGGYDPLAVAQGKPLQGMPEIWAVIGSRLALFSSEANRAAVVGDAGNWLSAAAKRWPSLRRELAR
jgi:YHS domain-containing protein